MLFYFGKLCSVVQSLALRVNWFYAVLSMLFFAVLMLAFSCLNLLGFLQQTVLLKPGAANQALVIALLSAGMALSLPWLGALLVLAFKPQKLAEVNAFFARYKLWFLVYFALNTTVPAVFMLISVFFLALAMGAGSAGFGVLLFYGLIIWFLGNIVANLSHPKFSETCSPRWLVVLLTVLVLAGFGYCLYAVVPGQKLRHLVQLFQWVVEYYHYIRLNALCDVWRCVWPQHAIM